MHAMVDLSSARTAAYYYSFQRGSEVTREIVRRRDSLVRSFSARLVVVTRNVVAVIWPEPSYEPRIELAFVHPI